MHAQNGQHHNSIVVLEIRPKFWWMLPVGVKDNNTKYEPETQRWRPGTGIARARPRFQNVKFVAKTSLFWSKTAPEPVENGQSKEDGGFYTHR